MLYKDPATHDVFEFRYIVTHTEAEGPERLEFRNNDAIAEQKIDDAWRIWPDDLPVPSEVNAHFHGEVIPWDFDVPPIFDVFAIIRMTRDDLKALAKHVREFGADPKALNDAIERLTKYGDLDENYIDIATAALAGDLEARGQLERLVTRPS